MMNSKISVASDDARVDDAASTEAAASNAAPVVRRPRTAIWTKPHMRRWRILALAAIVAAGITGSRRMAAADPAEGRSPAATAPDAAKSAKPLAPAIVLATIDGKPVDDLEVNRAMALLGAQAPPEGKRGQSSAPQSSVN